MSITVVFIIGCAIFAITVYGTVMAGGTLLTRRQIETDPVINESPMIAARPLGDSAQAEVTSYSSESSPTTLVEQQD